MVSRAHFLTVHNGVRMGLRGVDESLFPVIAPRLLGEVLGELQATTAIYTDDSKTKSLVGNGKFLEDRDSYRFRLPGHGGIFTAEMCAIHFQDHAGLTTVNTSDIHTRARTRLLTEWQESWNVVMWDK
jgi:hypothetical protein